MKQNQMKEIINREIKPVKILWQSRLDTHLNDNNYNEARFKTIEEIQEALILFTPLPYILEEWDCDDQTYDVCAFLGRAGIKTGWAISPDHSVKGMFSDGSPWKIQSHMFAVTLCKPDWKLVVIEGKNKNVMSYQEAQKPEHNGVYDLSKGITLWI